MQDLNLLYASLLNGSSLHVANAISPNGRYIVGYGFNMASQKLEAYLLDTQAIPEPSSLLLFGAGLAGLLRWRRHRQ
jgi:hypothetical protein